MEHSVSSAEHKDASRRRRRLQAKQIAHEARPTRTPRPTPARRRPIVLVVGDLAEAAERAWLSWALAADGALVLPGDPVFAAWGLFWPRPTDALLPVEDLAPVRAVLPTLGSARSQRRRLSRLARLVVHGGPVVDDERAAWAAIGVALSPFPSDDRQ
jgi:hypothetical protein